MTRRNKYEYHGMSKTKLYNVWHSIKTRCEDKKCKCYNEYGGRGISLCAEWSTSFLNFEKWAKENGYSETLQIDRKDNDGNYEPNNCSWVTNKKNNEIGKRRKFKTNTSGFTGVKQNFNKDKWVSYIIINGNYKHLGTFNTIDQAVKARVDKEIELFGEQKTNLEWLEGRG